MLNDTLGMTGHRLYVYAALSLDQDNRVGTYQEMRDKAYMIMSQLNQVTAFIEPEILKIPEEKLRSFIATDKNLAVYKFYLDDIIRRKAHIRSEEIEEILAQAAPVTAGPSRIFTMIDDADVTIPQYQRRERQRDRDDQRTIRTDYGIIRSQPSSQGQRDL